MARPITVSRYPWHKGTPWAVNIPATLGGKRRREFFKTRQQAEKRKADLSERVLHHGIGAIRVGSTTVAEALNDYLTAKAEQSSQRHFEGLTLYAGRMRAAWGKLPIASISIRDIEKLIRNSSWSQRTRWNAVGYIRAFLAWCLRRKLIAENPADTLAQEMRRPDAPKAILSPQEMQLLLRLTRRDVTLRPFLVLCGFAGLRTIEAQRIHWEHLQDGEIHVARDVIKRTRGGWKERRIRPADAFYRHWPHVMGQGRIIPWTVRKFGLELNRLRKRMARVSARLALPWAARWQKRWPANCLRHSFASYHLAMHEDPSSTSYQMGHTAPGTLYREYAQAVRRAEAEKWWAL